MSQRTNVALSPIETQTRSANSRAITFPRTADESETIFVYDPAGMAMAFTCCPEEQRIAQIFNTLQFGNHSSDVVQLYDSRFLVAVGYDGFSAFDLTRERTLYSRTFPFPRGVGNLLGATMVTTRDTTQLFLIGGRNAYSNQIMGTVMMLRSNRWGLLSRLNAPRFQASACAVGTMVVLTGGFHWNRQHYTECAKTEMLPSTDQDWQYGPDLNVARQRHCSVVVNEKVVVVLGGVKGVANRSYSRNNAGVPVTEIEAWHVETNHFLVVGNLETPVVGASAVVRYGEIFVVGREDSCFFERVSIDPALLSEEYLSARIAELYPEASIANVNASNASPSAPPQEMMVASTDNEPEVSHPLNKDAPSRLLQLSPEQVVTVPSQRVPAPERPTPQAAYSLQARQLALKTYIADLEKLCDSFLHQVEERVGKVKEEFQKAQEKVMAAYEEACDKEVTAIRQEGQEWIGETTRLVEGAMAEINAKEQFLKKKAADQTGDSFLNDHVLPANLDDYGDDIPSQLRCPITLNLMTDPVCASDGNVYERKSFEEWIQVQLNSGDGRPRSPLSGALLTTTVCFPVLTLKGLCEQFASHIKGANPETC